MEIQVEYRGLEAYADTLQAQEEHFNLLLKEKSDSGVSSSPMKLILCQHKPVYTLGKNGDQSNLLSSAEKIGAEFYFTNRGGDITFHGPGQLVGYPILDLERLDIGLATYLELLEESIIHCLKSYDIEGDRLKGASGVWLDVGKSTVRKICAMGIKSSRWITMHGFAFNINTDLKYFDLINPCGFTDKGVTSIQKELSEEQDFESVTEDYIKSFGDIFKAEMIRSISHEKIS